MAELPLTNTDIALILAGKPEEILEKRWREKNDADRAHDVQRVGEDVALANQRNLLREHFQGILDQIDNARKKGDNDLARALGLEYIRQLQKARPDELMLVPRVDHKQIRQKVSAPPTQQEMEYLKELFDAMDQNKPAGV
jgi:hypothetical protein